MNPDSFNRRNVNTFTSRLMKRSHQKRNCIPIDSVDIKFDLHLYLKIETVIGCSESRDLLQPITVDACKNK